MPAFPSPLGVIFSLIIDPQTLEAKGLECLFPSPLGVIFSLIRNKDDIQRHWKFQNEFPSPLGVIFSLI